MKNYTGRRKSCRKKPRNILLIITKNIEYKKTQEYSLLINDYKGFKIHTVVIKESILCSNIKKVINTYSKELDLNKNRGDKIIVLSDLLGEVGDAMKKTNALK